jgi:hypothetical protein
LLDDFILKLRDVPAKKIFRYRPDKPVREIMDAILYLGSGPDETVNEAQEALDDADSRTELKRRRNVALPLNAKPPIKKIPRAKYVARSDSLSFRSCPG